MTDTNSLQGVKTALQSLESALPTIINIISIFFPGLKAIIPFLPLLQKAIDAVEIVAEATGGNVSAAMAEVVSHLTPGQPNSVALTNNANQGS